MTLNKEKLNMSRKGDLFEIVQEIETWSYYQKFRTQTRIHPGKGDAKIHFEFEIKILTRGSKTVLTRRKKRTCYLVDFDVSSEL